MKKVICILLMVLMTVSVCACARAKEPNVEQTSSAVAENEASSVSAPVSDAKTESKEVAVSDESRESSETDAVSNATSDTASDTVSDLLAGHIMKLPDDLFEGGVPIGVNGDWIYYDNGYGRLVGRVKIDGSDRLRYENERMYNANVESDRIYYIDEIDDRHLYSMKHDGTDVNLLCADVISIFTPISVVDGRVYYMYYVPAHNDDPSGMDLSIPYSINTDGTDKRKLGDNANPQALPQADGWIYTREGYVGGRMFKMRPDGSEKTYLTDDIVVNLKVHDGWIYYTLFYKGGLFKMRTDGTDNQMLYDNVSNYLDFETDAVFDETCIYTVIDHKLCAIEKDGTGMHTIGDAEARLYIGEETNLFAGGHTLFFRKDVIDYASKPLYERGIPPLYAIEKDGMNECCITKIDRYHLQTDNGFFYESEDAIYFYSYEKIER